MTAPNDPPSRLRQDDTARTILWGQDAEARRVEEDDRAHYLVLVRGDEPGRRFDLTAKTLVIGRSSAVDIPVHDPLVSKRHCEVALFGDPVSEQAVATDLGSTNGTFVDARRIEGRTFLPLESMLGVGTHLFKHELRSRREVREAASLSEEIARAASYATALLPRPLDMGPVRTAWTFVPSAALGGDTFGYQWLDPDRFMLFLLDVSGHGVGAAMHSVSIANVLRSRSLPDSDFTSPTAVLFALNELFPMERCAGMFFTIWYGVYSCSTRRLVYASAGHPPALLASGGSLLRLLPLATGNPPVGAIDDRRFDEASVEVPPGSRLHLFSDGVYEVALTSGARWSAEGLRGVISDEDAPTTAEPERIRRAVATLTGRDRWDDDFSLLVAEFA